MTITIKDVAKQANVSISTVSRVINDSKPVSDEIKLRVMAVIDDLGYSPNPVARSLVTRKSRLIGVIVPDIGDAYIAEVLNAIEEVAKTYDYDIVLCNSYGSLESETHYMNLLRMKQVEGMVFITYRLRTLHKTFFENNKMPVVMVNRDGTDLGISSVSVNHYEAIYEMTLNLIDSGHKNIALIRNGKTKDLFGPSHLEGFKKAHEDRALTFNDTMIYQGHFKMKEAYEIATRLVAEDKIPDALIATTDDMAIGALNGFVDQGYKVPEDLSVVSFCDTQLASLYRPQLTTIHQPIYDIGAVAIRLLIKQIKNESKNKQHVYLPHTLEVRNSSKKR